jgi:hypothetical protein
MRLKFIFPGFFSGNVVVLLLLAFVMQSGVIQAQKTKVYGHVLDADTKEPIAFANIAYIGSKVGTTSNMDGYFEIETYYATDSLAATYVGYLPQKMYVKIDKTQKIDFLLKSGEIELGEFVVRAKDFENPAHRIIRNIIKNKPVNNKEKLEAYQFQAYNKMEFDLNNFKERFTKRKLWKSFDFVFDNIDSTTSAKVFLPMIMTESISDLYFRKRPRAKQEIIRATRMSGINNQSVSQFIGQMYLDMNIYDNNMVIFEKSFISPISNVGFAYYKYYLNDSAFVGNKWCYHIQFTPKRKQELTFEGEFWVNDTTWAIKELDASIAKDANINFVNELDVKQMYEEVENEVWMLTYEAIVVDFSINKGQTGVYGRRTSYFKDFKINEPLADDFYSVSGTIEMEEGHTKRDQEYWKEARHVPLPEREEKIYVMVDSLERNKKFQSYVDFVNLLITGYKIMGPVEWGPFWTTYSWNPVEGDRLRMGGRTSNSFSTRLMLEGYVAYGLKDRQFKWSGGGQYFLTKKPWQHVGLYFTRDLEQLGMPDNFFSRDNMFTTFLRRTPPFKLIEVHEWKGHYEREWFSGFSNRLQYTRRYILPVTGFEFYRLNEGGLDSSSVSSMTSSEISLKTRFAHKERFLFGEFVRVSLGTRFPILEMEYGLGIKGFVGGGYDYHRFKFSVYDKLMLSGLGYLRVKVEAGKYWGKLPYPMLAVHQGNETFFSSETAFNLMNFYEFVSDQYLLGWADYHLEGFFLNRIPLFRKLKWREVVGARAVIGSLNQSNLDELLLPEGSYTLNRGPYSEASIGIENIFKFIRVEAIWRLNYLDHDRISNFGVRMRMGIKF